MTTKICMRFGKATVPAELNDTETARAFASKFPATIRVSGTGIDFCGRMPFELPYEESQVGCGWTNGDVNYNPGGGWFAVLFDDEENSSRYGDQVNMGRVTSPLDSLHGLSGSYDLVIERA
jgi:hypothetical protein